MKLKFDVDSALVIVMLNVTYAYESFLVWYDILYQYAWPAAAVSPQWPPPAAI